nr:MAG TPA: hypothetical protein [Caudoviricetes sp.]
MTRVTWGGGYPAVGRSLVRHTYGPGPCTGFRVFAGQDSFLGFGCWLAVRIRAVTCGFTLWCRSLFPWLPTPLVIGSRKW